MWYFIMITVWVFIAIILVSFILKQRRQDKKYWNEHDHTKAEIRYTVKGTPVKGNVAIVVNPHKWVIVDWDVEENRLDIWEPKHTYKTPDGYKLGKGSLNWKLLMQKYYVSAEEYFSRTRIR